MSGKAMNEPNNVQPAESRYRRMLEPIAEAFKQTAAYRGVAAQKAQIAAALATAEKEKPAEAERLRKWVSENLTGALAQREADARAELRRRLETAIEGDVATATAIAESMVESLVQVSGKPS